MTPYYQRGGITIYHADCRDVLPTLAAGSVGLVLTDPPYGIGWEPPTNHGNAPWIDDHRPEIASLLIGVHNCVWGGNYFTDQLRPSESWLLWVKRPEAFNFDNEQRSFAVCEMAWTDYGGKPRTRHQVWDGGKRQGDPSNRSFCHPAQKPLELMRWCITLAPNAPQMIFDPFMGSGTTLRAAMDLGRSAVGCEVIEQYAEVAAKRLSQEVMPL